MPSPRWRKLLSTSRRGEEKLLYIRPGPLFQSSPLSDGKKHRGLYTAPGHDLRSFSEGRIEQFAEPGLGILNGPLLTHFSPPALLD